nr:efflux transporter outer membrane subunit [uncultured Sphingomonas sp.]
MKKLVTIACAISLTACSMEPSLPVNSLPVPLSWPAGDPYLRQTEASLPSFSYRDAFRDPRLVSLIEQSFANNRDLMVAAANIAAARAQAGISKANRLPEVTAGAGAAVTGDGKGNRQPNYDLSISVPSFEIDLFGRLASLAKADGQRLLATEAGARSVRLALIADIARAWAAYAADASLLSIAEQTAANAQRNVELTQARLSGGIAPRTDLTQASQILETARSDVAAQRTALAQDVNLLQLLVGAPIDTAALPRSIDNIAGSFAAPPAGLDSQILLRRPDIMQSEFTLRAANAEIGAARAALFPTISLTGLLGLASTALTGLFKGGAFGWSASGDARYAIFQGGAGKARIALSEAQRDAALASYEKSIQGAFREVADALADRGTVGERLRSADAQVAATDETLMLVNARYREGIDSYLAMLDAQRSAYSAQRARVVMQQTAINNVATLYQVLGGN